MTRSPVLVALLVCGVACGGDDPATSLGDAAADGPSDTGSTGDSSATDTGLAADTGATDTATDTGSPGDGAPDADPWGVGYPAGPYGINAGQVLANLDWEGYVNDKADAVSTTKPFVPTSLDKERRKGRYGVLHVAEFL